MSEKYRLPTQGFKPDDHIFADQSDVDSVFGIHADPSDSLTEPHAIDAIVASQKAAGDPIDPNGARKFVRALVALGLLKLAAEG